MQLMAKIYLIILLLIKKYIMVILRAYWWLPILLTNCKKAGFVGVHNGELTDYSNKILFKDYSGNDENYEIYRFIDYCATAAKKYSIMFITSENVTKTKTKSMELIKVTICWKIHYHKKKKQKLHIKPSEICI